MRAGGDGDAARRVACVRAGGAGGRPAGTASRGRRGRGREDGDAAEGQRRPGGGRARARRPSTRARSAANFGGRRSIPTGGGDSGGQRSIPAGGRGRFWRAIPMGDVQVKFHRGSCPLRALSSIWRCLRFAQRIVAHALDIQLLIQLLSTRWITFTACCIMQHLL